MIDKKTYDKIKPNQLIVQTRKRADIEVHEWLKLKYEEEAKEQDKVVIKDVTERDQLTSTDLFNDRLKRLEEHFHKDSQVKEQKRPIPRDITAERTAWLIGQFSESRIIDERKEIITTDLVAGRQKRLEEQFHKEPEMKEHDQPTSRLTAERAAWLEGKWKNDHATNGCHQPVSTELITGRLKWLEEQFQKEPEVKGQNQRQERSEILSTSDEHKQRISTGPKTGRFKWLRQNFQKDPKLKKKKQPLPRSLSKTITQNRTADRKARFEEKRKEKVVKKERSDSSSMRSSFLRSRRSCRVQPIL